MVKSETISVRIEKEHEELFKNFQPHFGSSVGEVLRNLALRWVESNITDPNIIDLAERGYIKLEVNKI
jgi:hypothetical protein